MVGVYDLNPSFSSSSIYTQVAQSHHNSSKNLGFAPNNHHKQNNQL